MFQFRTFPMAVLVLGVLACAPAPVGYPITAQSTIYTASHWQTLAADTAKRITGLRDSAINEAARLAEIAGEPFTEADFALADNVSFYVEPLDPAMPFARAFHELLITNLVQNGANVVLHKEDAYVVHYAVQPVRHDNTDTVNLDAFSEVMITVSLLDGGKLLMRRSRVYYVDDDEFFQYLATVPPLPISRYDSVGRVSLPVRQFAVVDGETALAYNQAPPDVKAGPLTVYFAFDSTDLDDAAATVVAEIADSQRRSGASVVITSGHTDRAGSASYNTALSRRRAEAVARALNAADVSRDNMVVEFFGENRPAVPTDDGERRPENRRVEIYLQ
ncbi:MAG: OmpA family protein [Alphaproteobacteria bacterium]|nr:OmpA family protein [Alphaproteobacteria bacterium]